MLDRTGRAVRLTGSGATYVHHARGALRDLATAERAVQDIAGLSRGSVRLALTPTFSAYLLGPPAAALYTAHPGITLDVREMPQDRVEAGLLADDHDPGIAFHGPHAAGIAAAPLFTETLGLVTAATAQDPEPAGPLSVREPAGRRLALLGGDFATRGHVDACLAAHGVRPHVAVEANPVQALSETVRRTTPATVLPDAVTDDDPHLRPVPPEPALPRPRRRTTRPRARRSLPARPGHV
ncbi:LysR substrate-binding domain-containing protein [Streptomyces sp. H27-S2]|uniref:LysR substrate-binding domain-containing protein n=1 Tax=Streptomyces antarcticus TaxID=2996458 RepID=UPI002D1E433B|nr:LysR substrate-binding domain-containing protein [Streptomyces sp. H27-S2]